MHVVALDADERERGDEIEGRPEKPALSRAELPAELVGDVPA
jgi:hypothetical protein